MLVAVASVVSAIGASGAATRTTEAVGSAPAELRSLLERLQRHYQETDTFSAAFKETIARVGAPPKDRSGTVYYHKPGRVRFDFGDPQPETVVSDGKLLYDYDPGLNQVMETPIKNAIKTQAAAAFLLGVGNVERDFKASEPASPANDGLIHLLLTPKAGGDPIGLGLDPHTLDIMSLKLADALGNTTVLRFSEIRTNITIEPSRFVFKTPDGADVVSSPGVQ